MSDDALGFATTSTYHPRSQVNIFAGSAGGGDSNLCEPPCKGFSGSGGTRGLRISLAR